MQNNWVETHVLGWKTFNVVFICFFTAKNGADPSEASKLYEYIRINCDHLKVIGLMTIGKFDHDLSTGPNPDFQVLQHFIKVCLV